MNDSLLAQPAEADLQPGFSPGATLRSAREARGLTIEEVAHALKLAPRQIEAIEADAFDQLRALTFARGFVRNYARFVGLDPEPLVGVIVSTADPRQIELSPVSNAQGEMPVARSSFGSLLPAALTLIVLIGVAFAGWHLGWYRVPDPVAALEKAEEAPAPASEQKVEIQQSVVSNPAGPVAESPVVAVPPIEPASAQAAAPALPQEPVSMPAPVVAEKAPPAPGSQRLSFEFDEDSWVEIRDAQGRIAHSQLHKAGSAPDVDVAGAPPFALVIGNAGKVRLRHNDKTVDLAPFTKVSVARLNVK